MRFIFIVTLLISAFMSIGVEAQTISTPNMSLLLPVPGQETGPQWALDLNTALTLVDGHDHTSGKGVQVPTAGLNINADLTCNSHNLTTVRSTRYANQTFNISGPADIGATYEKGGDLWYNNAAGQQVQITSGPGLSLTAANGFSGDFSTSTAVANYTSSSGKFTFTQATLVPAKMDTGPLVLRTTETNPKGITLTPPNSLVADYQITLPAALPGTTQLLTMTSSGVIAANTDPAVTVPTGVISAFGGTVAPTGYVLCDGSSLLRAGTYANLFAAIGTAYGTVDGSHFNVPDLRGQFLRGVTGAAATDPDASSRTFCMAGGATANNVGSCQTDQFKAHHHLETWVSGGVGNGVSTVAGSVPVDTTVNTRDTGGSETRPTNVYVNYIIKI